MATVRNTCLHARQDRCVHIRLDAHAMGVLTLGHSTLDGTNIHADASKSRAIRDTRRLARDSHLRTEVDTVFALTAHAEQTARLERLVIADASACRHARLAHRAQANAV